MHGRHSGAAARRAALSHGANDVGVIEALRDA